MHRHRRISQCLPFNDELLSFGACPQGLFLQRRLFQQPVRNMAQQLDMRPAAANAARPEPELIGEQHGHTALVLMRNHQQRGIIGAA